MDYIKKIILSFLESERQARNSRNSDSGDIVTLKLKEMYSFCDKSMYNKLDVIINENNEYRQPEEFKGQSSEQTRHLFKISEYNHAKHGRIFIAFTSIYLDNDRIAELKVMDNFFILSKMNDTWQIVKSGILDPEDPEVWIDESGLNDLSIDALGEFVKAERYLEPEDDEDDMAKYFADE